MRAFLAAWTLLTLLTAGCAAVSPESAQAAPAAENLSLEACVAAAEVRADFAACKGLVSGPCLNTPGGETTARAAMCYQSESARWESVRDQALQRIALQTPDRQDDLTRQFEAWRAWRQQWCGYIADDYEGGSLARVLAASCIADVNADYAATLILAERDREMRFN